MADSPLRIELIPNGPAMVQTDNAEIKLADGSIVTKDKPFALCRCGASANKPFCDGTHTKSGFEG
jgi:CDGSH-type Zn-finger protein